VKKKKSGKYFKTEKGAAWKGKSRKKKIENKKRKRRK